MFRRNGEITLRSVQCQDYGWDGERRRESACCYDCTFSSVNGYFTPVGPKFCYKSEGYELCAVVCVHEVYSTRGDA